MQPDILFKVNSVLHNVRKMTEVCFCIVRDMGLKRVLEISVENKQTKKLRKIFMAMEMLEYAHDKSNIIDGSMVCSRHINNTTP